MSMTIFVILSHSQRLDSKMYNISIFLTF